MVFVLAKHALQRTATSRHGCNSARLVAAIAELEPVRCRPLLNLRPSVEG